MAEDTAAKNVSKDTKDAPPAPTRTPPRAVRRAVKRHVGWVVTSPIQVKIGERTVHHNVGDKLEFEYLSEKDESVFSSTGVIEARFETAEE